MFLSFRFCVGHLHLAEIHTFLETVERFAWEVGPEEADQKQRRNCKTRFPIAEFAKQRAELRAEYLSKSKEIGALKKSVQRLQDKVIIK